MLQVRRSIAGSHIIAHIDETLQQHWHIAIATLPVKPLADMWRQPAARHLQPFADGGLDTCDIIRAESLSQEYHEALTRPFR